MPDLKDSERNEGGFVVPEIPIAASYRPEAANGDSDVVAPLIFNAWYAIALGKDVSRTLGAIKVLGQPLVYYRGENGQPHVLDDRCAHRRYPLSKGKLEGDAIQCGYHGFTYASSGQCIWAPGSPSNQQQKSKLSFGVRAYPCAERGPWLWVWMGKPELADPKDIPLPDLEVRSDASAHGYKLNPCNYMMVIENLLDLSHLHFLHGATDLEHVAVVPSEAAAPPNGVAWKKVVERCETGLIGAECGDDPKHIVRLEDEVTQIGPSLTCGLQRRTALAGDPVRARPGVLTVIHALTPIDHRSTHQFFMIAMSDPLARGASEMLHHAQEVVFEQDVEVVRHIQNYVDADVRPGRVEFSMAYDRFGMKMRRILKELKERELRLA